MRISDWSSDVCSSDLTAGLLFTSLTDWDERPGEDNSTQVLVGRAFAKFSGIKEAMVFHLNPPSISSLGIAGGFTFKLQDRAGLGQIGRAHVCTHVTNAQLVCRLLLEKTKNNLQKY